MKYLIIVIFFLSTFTLAQGFPYYNQPEEPSLDSLSNQQKAQVLSGYSQFKSTTWIQSYRNIPPVLSQLAFDSIIVVTEVSTFLMREYPISTIEELKDSVANYTDKANAVVDSMVAYSKVNITQGVDPISGLVETLYAPIGDFTYYATEVRK